MTDSRQEPRSAAPAGSSDPARRGPEGKTRAVGYLRVSTQGQADRGMSLAAQRDRVTEYAKEHGWQLVDVVEEAASGGVREGEVFSWEHRHALLALLDKAQAGEFDILLVARLDRLSRDHTTLVALERRLQRIGVQVVSTAEANGDGPVAELIRGTLANIAQFERALILERVSAGKAKGKQLGRHVHGRAPYGYTTVRGILTPSPAFAPIVHRIFKNAKEGDSPGQIARALNAEGIAPPQRAKAWGERAVRVIIRNPGYVGERYNVQHAHEAVVSRRLFNAAQRALDARADDWRASRRTERGPPG
jgi:site-specific DNA recombinase